MKNAAVINCLGYAGLIPFLAAASAMLGDYTLFQSSPALIFLTYSAIILSFLGGTLWGKARELADGYLSAGLLLLSNVLALTAWMMLLLGETFIVPGLLIALIGYAILCAVEWLCASKVLGGVGESYLRFRLTLTLVVCLAHAVVISAAL
jgi:hypothetical protein